jgi:soluble lytic murein transglycosylase
MLVLLIGCGAPATSPANAQASIGLDAATIARYRARLADNERSTAGQLPGSPLVGVAPVPVLEDVVLWDRLRREAYQGVFSEYAAFLAGHSDWPQAITIRRLAEKRISDTTPVDAIIRHFRAAPPLTADGKWRLAEALASTGQGDAAIPWARDAWDSSGLDDAAEARLLARFGASLRPQDHVGRMDRLLWADRTTPAARMLPRVDTDTRLWALARIALRRAAPDVQARLGGVPAGLRREAGLLHDEARWLLRNNRASEAHALLAGGGATPLVPSARITTGIETWLKTRLEIGRSLWRAGDHAQARAVLASHGLNANIVAAQPVSERAAYLDAEWLAGWLALRKLNQPALALGHFRNARAVSQSPISQARGDYWSGRAAEASGQRDTAQQFYAAAASHPDYFYGQLAVERLGRPLQLVAAQMQSPDAIATGNFRTEPRVRAALALADIDRARQTIFLKHLANTADTPARAALVAGLAGLAGPLQRLDVGVNAAKATRDSAGLGLISASFPTLQLPADLLPNFAIIHAITRQESQFDRAARSSANALGMMQLLPATAAEQAKKLGLPASPVARLTEDPVYNVTLGSAYITRMRSVFGGSMPLAVASYNAGPGNARRFITLLGRPEDGDVIDWIESIPFAETRNYVQRVLENAVVYETLNPQLATTRGPNRLSEWLGKATPG